MRPMLFAVGLALAVAEPAVAMEENMTFSMMRAEVDAARIDDADVAAWEADAWIGGDTNKFWLKSEGEIEDGAVRRGEVQALWSRNVASFWDLQAGVRADFEPDTTGYLVLGLQGLAPYQFETEAAAFVSEDGDASARLKQSFDLLLTQRWILEPHVEVNLSANDVAERRIGAGVTDVEAGLQLRYEFSRKFAPYLDLEVERALGETASLTRRAGEDVEESAVRAGVRFWF